MKEDELCVRVLCYDPQEKVILQWYYFPGTQRVLDPAKRFDPVCIKNKEGNLVTITLKHVKDPGYPYEQTLQDEILYSYYEN